MSKAPRGRYNWADRYPWIVEAALKNRFKQFVIDGEAVMLGVDRIPDFNQTSGCASPVGFQRGLIIRATRPSHCFNRCLAIWLWSSRIFRDSATKPS